MGTISAREVFDRGTRVFFTHTIRAVDLEQWVLRVADASGQDLAWTPAPEGAWVFALGDVRKVLQVMRTLREEHDRAFTEASGHRAGLASWLLNTEVWGPVEVLLDGFRGMGQTASRAEAPPPPEHAPEESGSTILTLQLDDD